MHDIVSFHVLANTEVGDLDVTLTVEQDVVQLDVTMQNALLVNVAKALDNLSEDDLGLCLIQLFALSHVVQ